MKKGSREYKISWLMDILYALVFLGIIGGLFFVVKTLKTTDKENHQYIEQVDNKLNVVQTELNESKALFVDKIKELYPDDYFIEDDIDVINNYLLSLTTKEDFNNFKSNIEDELELVDPVLFNSVMHRNIYRGKNLGTIVTDEQKTSIENGSFEDLFIGDYWTINNNIYRIADIDYFYRVGDESFNKHHLLIIPDEVTYFSCMNKNDTTTGGYLNSFMYNFGLGYLREKIMFDFDSMLLTHRDYFVSEVNSDGSPIRGAWVDSQVDLLSELMVYGCNIRSDSTYTTDIKQISLFRLDNGSLIKHCSYWLRDTASPIGFSCVSSTGSACYDNASFSRGVLPYFCIG